MAARGTGDYSIAKIVAAIVDRIESEGVDLDTELRKLLSLYESNNHRQLVEAYLWPGNRPSKRWMRSNSARHAVPWPPRPWPTTWHARYTHALWVGSNGRNRT